MTVTAQNRGLELGDKKASDLISEDTKILGDGTVEGTLKYVSGWKEFNVSNVEEQSGNYFPLQLGKTYKGKEITVKKNGEGDGKTAADTDWILRVSSTDTTFKFSEGKNDIVTLNFKNATLKPNPVKTAAAEKRKKTTKISIPDDSLKAE